MAASLQLDRSPLDGWLGPTAWADARARLSDNLASLNVPPSLIDRTLADMEAIAASAGVSYDEYATYTAAFEKLRDAEQSLPSGAAHFPDPGLYYTQHLRGFFRGGAAQLRRDRATLASDERATGADAGSLATLRRDANLVEEIGADLTAAAGRHFADAFVGLLEPGPPTRQQQAQLLTELPSIAGPGLSGATNASIGRLIADAPAFDRAAGSSSDHARTIVAGALKVAEDGGASSPNPFRIDAGGRTGPG